MFQSFHIQEHRRLQAMQINVFIWNTFRTIFAV